MTSALWLLAVPSAGILVALAAHAVLNRGPARAGAYFTAVLAYGALRGASIHWITEDQLGVPFPYLMNQPVASFRGVSLQELLGWALAATLAWVLADRLLLRLGIAPGPWRVTAIAALGMAAVCLAVESAAIAAGWWTWTLALPTGWIRVPPVALLDWGFVAFDFVLPFLLFATGASPLQRAAGLCAFPVHMAGHLLLTPLPGPLPVTGNDLAHVGIVALVLAAAIGERPASALPAPAAERWPAVPAVCALVVAGCTTLAVLLSPGPAATSLATAAPLALLALPALLGNRAAPAAPARGRKRRRAEPEPPARTGRARLVVAAAALAVLALDRAPAHRRQQRYLASLDAVASRIGAQDWAGAEREAREAVKLRPEHPAGHTFLGLALLRQHRPAEGRAELEAALAEQPTSHDALLVMIQLDLREGRRQDAASRASLGRRTYPEAPDFAYYAELAAGTAGPGVGPSQAALEVARRRGPEALRGLAAVARSFGDGATAEAALPSGPAGSR